MVKENKGQKILLDLSQLSEKIFDLLKKEDDVKKAESIFVEELKQSELKDAVSFWIKKLRDEMTLNSDTISNYERYIKDLFLRGILPSKNHLGEPFCVDELYFNRKNILKILEDDNSITDKEKRYRLNALIAFSKFLEEKTGGFFEKFRCPASLALTSTNRSPIPKMLTVREYSILRGEFLKISKRDGLVLDLMYLTARSLTKILSINLDQVDCENKKVYFANEKNEFVDVKINSTLAIDLKSYIKNSAKYRKNVKNLFITKSGNPIFRTRFAQVFKKASERANLGFIATSKMVQRSFLERCRKTGLTKENIMKRFNLKKLPKHGDDEKL